MYQHSIVAKYNCSRDAHNVYYTHFGRGEPPSELSELTLERPFNLLGKDDPPAGPTFPE